MHHSYVFYPVLTLIPKLGVSVDSMYQSDTSKLPFAELITIFSSWVRGREALTTYLFLRIRLHLMVCANFNYSLTFIKFDATLHQPHDRHNLP